MLRPKNGSQSTVLALAVTLASAVFSAGVDQSANAARGQSAASESVEARVDALFAQWNKRDSPGCIVAVGRNGAVLYERGYGMANLELAVPITSSSVFEGASISKAFTAMSVMLLAQAGKLSLDDDVLKHIPEWSYVKDRVTLRHLLSHTAGLRDVFLLVELAAPRRPAGDFNQGLVHLLARQRGLNFTPGSDFQYNNGAYVVLADIVKRVSGQPLPVFAEVNIFRPLGMTHSRFQDDGTRVVANRASGYYRDAGGELRQAIVQSHPPIGNSGLLSTARDLLVWLQNFSDARVGDRALLAEMQMPAAIAGGYKGSFGLGLEVGDDGGLKTIGHGGGGGGWGTYAVRYPDRGLNVVVLCNLEDIAWTVGALARNVARLYLDSRPASPSATAEMPRVELSAEQLASKAGLYRDPGNGTIGRVFVRDGKLMASGSPSEDGQVFELVPVAPTRFVIPNTPVVAEFVAPERGRPQEIRVTGAGPKPTVSQQVTASFTPSPLELRAFAADYSSSELEVTFTVAVRSSGLVAERPDGETFLCDR